MPYLRNKRTGETVFVPDGSQQVAAPNPLKVQGARADVANTQAGAARTMGQEARDQALFELNKRKLAAEASKAEAEAKTAGGLDKQKLANIRAAQGQVDRVRRLFEQGPAKTKGLSGILDLLPGGVNSRMKTAGAGLGEVGLAAFRVPGVGGQSDAELRAFIDANRPSPTDLDVTVEEKLNNLQNRLNEVYSSYNVKRPGAAANDGWKIERIED